jgi:hypothetical protein
VEATGAHKPGLRDIRGEGELSKPDSLVMTETKLIIKVITFSLFASL